MLRKVGKVGQVSIRGVIDEIVKVGTEASVRGGQRLAISKVRICTRGQCPPAPSSVVEQTFRGFLCLTSNH